MNVCVKYTGNKLDSFRSRSNKSDFNCQFATVFVRAECSTCLCDVCAEVLVPESNDIPWVKVCVCLV